MHVGRHSRKSSYAHPVATTLRVHLGDWGKESALWVHMLGEDAELNVEFSYRAQNQRAF